MVVNFPWLPLAAFPFRDFKPMFDITWMEALVFFLAIWGAYLIRTMLLSFWHDHLLDDARQCLFELYLASN